MQALAAHPSRWRYGYDLGAEVRLKSGSLYPILVRLEPGLEDRAAAALVRAAGSPARARAAFGFIHGMLILELNGRFPDDGGLEPAWRAGLAAFNNAPPAARSR